MKQAIYYWYFCIEDRVRNAIDTTLLAKGYRKAESADTADFLVSFTAVAQTAIRADSVSTGMGYRRRATSLGFPAAAEYGNTPRVL